MKIRLMKSAAMVPMEARIRPLDKRSIDRCVYNVCANCVFFACGCALCCGCVHLRTTLCIVRCPSVNTM